jgi:hypothetical protein
LASGAQDAHAEAAPPATPGSRTLKETPHRPAGFAPAAETAGGETPEEIARHLLSALSARGGEALSAAAAQGTLFAQHGPAIFEAYDEYRRRAPKMGAGPFRDALRELWGVDLPEVTPRP